jgi:hypothetical protein
MLWMNDNHGFQWMVQWWAVVHIWTIFLILMPLNRPWKAAYTRWAFPGRFGSALETWTFQVFGSTLSLDNKKIPRLIQMIFVWKKCDEVCQFLLWKIVTVATSKNWEKNKIKRKIKKEEEKLTYNAHLKKIKWRTKNVKLTTTQSTFVR